MNNPFLFLPVPLFMLFPFSIYNAAKKNDEILIQLKNSKLRIQVVNSTIIRITNSPDSEFSARKSLSVLPNRKYTKWNSRDSGNKLEISTDSVIVSLEKSSGAISFYDIRNNLKLKTSPVDSLSFIPAVIQNEKVFHIKQRFILTQDEGIYGLGQFEDGIMNFRNHDILLEQANRVAVNPFLVSSKGYGIFWDNYSGSKFHDGKDGTYFWSEVADEIDFYFIYGNKIDEAISGYRELTGKAPLFAKWAYGYWQSKERYTTADELITVIKEYRKREIPIDNIIQDWQYWGEGDYFSGMVWDSIRYPHPREMADSLHKLNAHIIASIWPAFGIKSKIYKEMGKSKFLFNIPHWNGGKVYDAYNPGARSLYWKFTKKALFDNNIDGYWMDGSEPEFRCSDDRFITSETIKKCGMNYLGSMSRYLTPFSLLHTRGIYENQRKVSDKRRVFILTRSAFSGQQRYASVTWSGDTFTSWDNLRVQVAAGINFSMSGIPYWNSDIGGFIVDSRFPDGCKNDSYRELYVRWFQFGAFCPMFRSHGTSTPREVWQFGDKDTWAYDALVKADKLRYSLMPYIYSTAWQVTKNNYSFIRGLVMDYPNDIRTYSLGNQFMFGSSILVCPVLKEMYYPVQNKNVDITPDHFYSNDETENGAELYVYKGTDFNELVLKRKIEACGIGWNGCLPLELDSCYSLRFDGKILSENEGTYKFIAATDGGIKLWINNQLLINNWENNSMKNFEISIDLAADEKYNFKIEHKQLKPNDANMKLTWIKPEVQKNLEKNINVYLPANQDWYNFWTGEKIAGGKIFKADAPIDIIPIFIPAGSIIPLCGSIQYAAETNESPLELRIYTGKDVEFTLYEDENETYNYEKGVCSEIPVKWDEKTRTLTIRDRKGKFPGMVKERIFNVVKIKDNVGTGLELTSNPEKVIKYNGKEVSIQF